MKALESPVDEHMDRQGHLIVWEEAFDEDTEDTGIDYSEV